MVNVVSSAIVNKPPPQAIANLLARRNKIHHLNEDTDETLLKLFDKDPGDSSKTANHNQVTMPSRNYAIITENSPNNGVPAPRLADSLVIPSNGKGTASVSNGSGSGGRPPGSSGNASMLSCCSKNSCKHPGKDGHSPLGAGEIGAGTKHRAASPTEHGRGNDGSLDVCIRVEIDQHDRNGRTEYYGLSVPALDYKKPAPPSIHSPVHDTSA